MVGSYFVRDWITGTMDGNRLLMRVAKDISRNVSENVDKMPFERALRTIHIICG